MLLVAGTAFFISCMLTHPLFSQTLYQLYAMMFFTGAFGLTRSISSFTLALEFAPQAQQKTINMMMVVWDGFMTIFSGLCFYLSPDMITHYSLLAFFFFSSFSIIILVVPESPDFLYNHRKFEELEACLMKVAAVNQVSQKEVLVP